MNNNIKCPNCNHSFPVEDALFSQAEEQIKKQYEEKIAQQATIFNRERQTLEDERKSFEEKKQRENEIFRQKLDQRLLEERNKLEKLAKEDFELKINQLKEENEKRKHENTALKQKELGLMKKEEELKEKLEEMDLQVEKKILEKKSEIAEEVKKKEQEKIDLKIKEYEKQLEDQKKLVEEMQRKAEQGSMQMQGEVQELAIEELLKSNFPFDIIEEVAKGIRGADAVQTVINPLQQVCGKIIYESKRTKSFSDGWIEKLKEDQRLQGAALAVIVTETLPKDMKQFGRKDGVWICSFQEVVSLTFVLREILIRESSIKSAEVNKGDKMELLYGYLISDEFKQRVESIVEGFSSLKFEMDREKRAMQKIWKEREKQIEKVISNTIDMYGSIKGIAGNAIGTVKALELPDDTID